MIGIGTQLTYKHTQYPDPLPPTIAIFLPAGTRKDSPFKMLALSI